MSPNQTKEICLFVPDAQTGRFLFNAESLESLGINPVEAQQRGYPMKEQTAFADFISIDDCAQFFPWDRGLGDNIGVGPIPAAAPIPRHPESRQDHKSLQAKATTCRNPERLDCPGFFFVAGQAD
jgi:hypothetical protein